MYIVAIIIIAFLLSGCVSEGTVRGAFGEARERQRKVETVVNATVEEVLEFTCDMDVKRLQYFVQKDPDFVEYFWAKCGRQFRGVVDSAVEYRNANPTPEPQESD